MAVITPTAHGVNGVHGTNGARPSEPRGEEEADQGIWVCGGTPLPVQLWTTPPSGEAPGGGFGQGEPLDAMRPGPELALLLPGAADVPSLSDGELTGVLRGWRRLGSWAAAMEHAAAAELARRRIAEAEACGARAQEVARYAAAEVAAALGLTRCGADGLMGRAVALAALPATWAALAAGEIDVPKALVILNGVSCLDQDLARAVEAEAMTGAAGQTTGELRKAVAQAVIAADPAAADQRVAEAQRSARVERWAEPCGTAALAGRDLPPAEALAANNRINALAAALKADGAPGGMDLLRAEVFVGLLLGRPVAAAADPAATSTHAAADQAAEHFPAREQNAAAQQNPAPEQKLSAQHDPAPKQEPSAKHNADPNGGTAADDGGFPADDSALEQGFAGQPGGTADRRPGTGNVEASRGGTDGQRPAAEPAAKAAGWACPGRRADDREPVPTGGQRVAAGQGQFGAPSQPSGRGWAGMAGTVNLTVPLRALLGQPSQPAEVAGFGPISPSVTGEILTAARSSPAVKWCVTVTGADGRAAGHGCAGRVDGDRAEPGAWGFTLTVRALEVGACSHARQSAAYKPPPLLRHLIQTRHRTCTAPGCGRPAHKCDLDHSIPYDGGGRTCECNLAPLCRFHHKVKQAQRWLLKQSSPGALEWVTPSGWRYTIIPSRQPI